mgnify:CR=1 FL=1
MIPSWILTFRRPAALNRQIQALKSWTDVHVFTNHPEVELTEDNKPLYQSGQIKILFNTLSDPDATAYCARSWNSIFLKVFKDHDEAIFIQDDTLITNPEMFRDLILSNKDRFDYILGPAGDQFFYMKKCVLEKVGFFDERYLGCYCGDADYEKRIYHAWDKSRISIVDSHDWGIVHNDIGISRIIPTDIRSKCIDSTYINQHHDLENRLGASTNLALIQSQSHFKSKWGTPGNGINGIGSIFHHINPPRFPEIPWYPWFDQKYLNDGPRNNGVYTKVE